MSNRGRTHYDRAPVILSAGLMLGVGVSALLYFGLGLDLLAFPSLGVPCPFNAVTGLACPGCGMTRALLLAREGFPLHPFNVRMHPGQLSRRAIQLWVANRYYFYFPDRPKPCIGGWGARTSSWHRTAWCSPARRPDGSTGSNSGTSPRIRFRPAGPMHRA